MLKYKVKNAKELKEVYEILKVIPEEEKNKISKFFLQFIEENMDENYEYVCDNPFDLDSANVLPGTIYILQMIYMDYWVDEDEKKDILWTMQQNDKKYQEEIEKQNNSYNIFDNNNNNSESGKEEIIERPMQIYKENKIISFFKKLFGIKSKNNA